MKLDRYLGMLKAEAQMDVIGLWELLKKAPHIEDFPAEMGPKERTLQIISAMLDQGFRPVDLRNGDAPDTVVGLPWKERERSAVLARIDREWTALGRDPNLWEVCWFDRPMPAADQA